MSTSHPIPTICDKCRAAGFGGDEAFSAIPDILNFTPVQRRAHVNGWTDEHQRAFIAALAITGSPRQAARAIGRHAFGAEQLRNHQSGKSFAAAWDAALELAREREVHRIHDNLAELAKNRDAELASVTPSPGPDAGRGLEPAVGHFPPGYDPKFDDEDRLEYLTAQEQVRNRMLNARRMLLYLYAADEDPQTGPARRAAWETLCGPVNWEQARNNEAEDGEAYAMRHARQADVMVCAEVGFLSDLTGGDCAITPLVTEALKIQASGGTEGEPQ